MLLRLITTILVPVLILGSSLSGCKKKDPEPLRGLEMLVGKWQLTARQTTDSNGETVWEAVDYADHNILIFRFDGIALDHEGLPSCCIPSTYYLNETRFDIVPKAALKENPTCHLVFCLIPESWLLKITGDELIISGSKLPGQDRKYKRL